MSKAKEIITLIEDYISDTIVEPGAAKALDKFLEPDERKELSKILKDLDAKVDSGKVKMGKQKEAALDFFFPIDTAQDFVNYLKAYAAATRSKPLDTFINNMRVRQR